ncbi:MAG: radical SAM protein [Candidatus Hydrogenedentes bacterium]|nr:radical SAM protein [Candidatus Hydrogenedentota bacterium]
MRYVYGPVPSRRLGWSLGVDLIPAKTCTFNCIYCQLGRSRTLTLERSEYVPFDGVLEEIREKTACRPDYITISGSGEPTLYSRLGELLDQIRSLTDVPLAVLTNGSLLWREDVREELKAASLVIPSLDAGNAAMFATINRPHGDLDFEQVLQGLVDFRESFAGQIWLEILLVAGFTANNSEIQDLSRCVERIRPDRVQLNTVTRPPAEDYAVAVPPHELLEYAQQFRPVAEVIGDAPSTHARNRCADITQDTLGLIRRRPCTLQDVANGLGIHVLEAVKHLEILTADARVHSTMIGSKVFYMARF